jgi:para-nitrobenzyl esterase
VSFRDQASTVISVKPSSRDGGMSCCAILRIASSGTTRSRAALRFIAPSSRAARTEIIASDGFRTQVITEAERKAAQPAPVYMYYFTWKTPVHDGKLKAFHTLEIPFVLANVDESKSMTGSGADRYPLQDKMSAAWAAFARTGNPNHKGPPNWPAFKMDQRATMIFDNQCKVLNDPHGEERMALNTLQAAARG